MKKACGIILCYPLGEEYGRSHRCIQQLAESLSWAGFPVLKFDFSGTGDSWGDGKDCTIAQCYKDISRAIHEMYALGGISKITLVGLRLGGTLSMILGALRGDINSMVLWDPIVEGQNYFEILKISFGNLQESPPSLHRKEFNEGKNLRSLLIPFTGISLGDIEGLNLTKVQQKPARKVLLIETTEHSEVEKLFNHLHQLEVLVETLRTQNPIVWLRGAGENKGLVPIQNIQSITSWISRETE
jgi:pimeloyl-ACP methyl ester carboxylesterase